MRAKLSNYDVGSIMLSRIPTRLTFPGVRRKLVETVGKVAKLLELDPDYSLDFDVVKTAEEEPVFLGVRWWDDKKEQEQVRVWKNKDRNDIPRSGLPLLSVSVTGKTGQRNEVP